MYWHQGQTMLSTELTTQRAVFIMSTNNPSTQSSPLQCNIHFEWDNKADNPIGFSIVDTNDTTAQNIDMLLMILKQLRPCLIELMGLEHKPVSPNSLVQDGT